MAWQKKTKEELGVGGEKEAEGEREGFFQITPSSPIFSDKSRPLNIKFIYKPISETIH